MLDPEHALPQRGADPVARGGVPLRPRRVAYVVALCRCLGAGSWPACPPYSRLTDSRLCQFRCSSRSSVQARRSPLTNDCQWPLVGRGRFEVIEVLRSEFLVDNEVISVTAPPGADAIQNRFPVGAEVDGFGHDASGLQ